MKRFLVLLFTAMLLLTACGAEEKESSKKSGKKEEKPNESATPESIEKAIREALGDGYQCPLDVTEDGFFLCALADVDMTKIASYVAKVNPVTAVHCDTVVVVRCREASYADEVVKAFNDFFYRQMNYAAQYPMEPMKLQSTRIYKAGDLVMYICAGASAPERSDDATIIRISEEEYKKIEEAVKKELGFLPENLADSDGDDRDRGEGVGASCDDASIED